MAPSGPEYGTSHGGDRRKLGRGGGARPSEGAMKALHSKTRVRLHRVARKVVRPLPLSLMALLAALPVLFYVFLQFFWDFHGAPAFAGAEVSETGLFDDGAGSVEYLDQGWSAGE